MQLLPLPHVTLFLDATPECCLERIHSRGRVSCGMINACSIVTCLYVL